MGGSIVLAGGRSFRNPLAIHGLLAQEIDEIPHTPSGTSVLRNIKKIYRMLGAYNSS